MFEIKRIYEYLGDGDSVLNDRITERCPTCARPDTPTVTIEAGAVVEAVGASYRISVISLSATQAIVTYTSGTNVLKARIVTVAGLLCTWGAEQNLTNTAFSTSVAKISSTQAVVIYATTGNVVHGAVLSISGNTVTINTAYNLGAAAATSLPVLTRLSSTQFAAAYVGAAALIQAQVLDVAGTVITPGAVATIGSTASENYPAIDALTSSKFIVSYFTQSPASDIVAVVCTVAASVVTAGSEYIVSTGSVSTSTTTIVRRAGADTVATVSWIQAGVGTLSSVRVDVAGTVCTPRTVKAMSVLASVHSHYDVSSTKQIIAYSNYTTVYPYFLVNTFGSLEITEGANTLIASETSFEHAITLMSGYKVIIVYKDAASYLQALAVQL